MYNFIFPNSHIQASEKQNGKSFAMFIEATVYCIFQYVIHIQTVGNELAGFSP